MSQHILTTVLTIAALATGQSAMAQDLVTIGSISYNSTLEAYEIASEDNLHDLAVYVNGEVTYSDNTTNSTAHDCTGLTFKVTGNKLQGPSAATSASSLVSDGQKVYVLSASGGTFGFFQFTGTIPANKAYYKE